MQHEQIHFVTGRLAEFSLRAVLERLAPQIGFGYTVQVLPITVAALMTTDWIAKRLQAPVQSIRIILPGYCQGELDTVEEVARGQCPGVVVERGPRDLHRLPEHFGGGVAAPQGYGSYDIEILAEINHAPQLERQEIVRQAVALRAVGADVIDLGCDPGHTWSAVGDAVAELVELGLRVSIDSLNAVEIAAATSRGAELVLSVNASNREAAVDWGCEVVAIPDTPRDAASLDETIAYLASRGVPLRIDPILEPIGFGFAESLGRYIDVRRRYPDAEMLMGIGNLTELTDADSAAVNLVLLGICQELGIRSVLTTQVINWARTSVRECDVGRRLAYYAVTQHALPKHVDPRLVMLRDARISEVSSDELDRLAQQIKDSNYRLFSSAGTIHAVTAGSHLSDADPFLLFERMAEAALKPIDSAHAFYLGYEMCKAATAITLGKNYEQDEPLDWGLLRQEERSHRLQRRRDEPSPTAVDTPHEGEGPAREPER